MAREFHQSQPRSSTNFFPLTKKMFSTFSTIAFIFSFFVNFLTLYMLYILVIPKGFFKWGRRCGGDETDDDMDSQHEDGGILTRRPHPLNFRSWSPQKRYRVLSVLALTISNILHLAQVLENNVVDLQLAKLNLNSWPETVSCFRQMYSLYIHVSL
jgi:hypothetical protein